MRDFYFVLQIVMQSDMAAKTAPTAHTPIQPSCVQANPAQYVPKEPPIKLVVINMVLALLEA